MKEKVNEKERDTRVYPGGTIRHIVRVRPITAMKRYTDHRIFEPIGGDYWCDCCDEPVRAEEWVDPDTGYIEIRCSRCHEEVGEEAKRCERCGEFIKPYTDIEIDGVCEDCIEDIDYAIGEAIKMVRKNLSYRTAKEYIKIRLENEDEI